MIKVAPSLLSANFACLKDDIEKIENGKADWLHYDVMDGHFVPNISFGYSILKDVSKVTNLFLDVHLMISEPQKYVDEFIKSGANLIVFHIEAMENKEDTLALIHHIKENNAHYLIEVDGGINATTGKQCKDAGVDVLVAGSYVFNSDDYTQRITSLK